MLFWNGQTNEFNGPFYVESINGPLPYTGGTSNVYLFTIYGEVGLGQIGAVEYDSVILLDSTATLQDFFALCAVKPYVEGVIDPDTGDSVGMQGGFF